MLSNVCDEIFLTRGSINSFPRAFYLLPAILRNCLSCHNMMPEQNVSHMITGGALSPAAHWLLVNDQGKFPSLGFVEWYLLSAHSSLVKNSGEGFSLSTLYPVSTSIREKVSWSCNIVAHSSWRKWRCFETLNDWFSQFASNSYSFPGLVGV